MHAKGYVVAVALELPFTASDKYTQHWQKRREWVTQNGFADRYEAYLTAKATSDDERDELGGKVGSRPIFWIKRRPERSAEAEAMIRALDSRMDADAGHLSRQRVRTDKIRLLPLAPQQTLFPTLPTAMPIDYFDPVFYNSLPPRLRATVADESVGLLPLASSDLYFTECPDEMLSEDDFQQKYGDIVLKKYKRDGRISRREYDGDYDDDDEADDDGEGSEEGLVDEDEEMSGLDEEEVGEYIAARRSNLAAQLSMDMEEDA